MAGKGRCCQSDSCHGTPAITPGDRLTSRLRPLQDSAVPSPPKHRLPAGRLPGRARRVAETQTKLLTSARELIPAHQLTSARPSDSPLEASHGARGLRPFSRVPGQALGTGWENAPGLLANARRRTSEGAEVNKAQQERLFRLLPSRHWSWRLPVRQPRAGAATPAGSSRQGTSRGA